VNAVNPSFTPFRLDGKEGAPILLDAKRHLELVDQVKVEASCDKPEPPNKCTW